MRPIRITGRTGLNATHNWLLAVMTYLNNGSKKHSTIEGEKHDQDHN